ncbi:unnamed protein product [Caenorhabditis auriculariae]|uniref:Uncharacterized protein n=1 Tax=Caenorhabditis auriculariae TaxID=2777116 RepID=A0A8S1H2N1_9PELO|nr:unnamed protein product [Caenorhabditis auriculariae]
MIASSGCWRRSVIEPHSASNLASVGGPTCLRPPLLSTHEYHYEALIVLAGGARNALLLPSGHRSYCPAPALRSAKLRGWTVALALLSIFCTSDLSELRFFCI